jgi:hypothetical protein
MSTNDACLQDAIGYSPANMQLEIILYVYRLNFWLAIGTLAVRGAIAVPNEL